MNKNPLISVVMPVFNGEIYLREAIESILNQSYSNFEFIIINDGSTDTTESIVSSYEDERIIYITQENSGVGASLRKGCELAKGKFIARMDADDISLLNRFAVQLKFLQNNPETILVSSAVKYINNQGLETGRSFPYTTNKAIIKKLRFGSPICHPAVMMKREIYLKTGGYKNVQPFEDLLLWLAFSKHGKLYNLSTPLLKYRVIDTSVSHSIPIDEKTKLLQFLWKNMNESGLNDKCIPEYMKLYKEINTQTQYKSKFIIESTKNGSTPSLAKLETLLYGFLSRLKTPEFIIESLICNLKKYIVLLS